MSKAQIVSIVDDDASVREATKDLVSSLGLEVFAFESAEEFLGSPLVDDTSCLITDVQMPGMKGYELQRHLAAAGRQMPVIFMTAFPEKIRHRPDCAGALAFLEKPFDAATLIDLLRDVMARSTPTRR